MGRHCFCRLFAAAILLVCTGIAEAQNYFTESLEASFGVQLLFGRQVVRHGNSDNGLREDLDPRFTVLTGSVELGPFSGLSARIGGSTAVLQTSTEFTKSLGYLGIGAENQWQVDQNFTNWEAGGQWNIYNCDGYRFSFLGGYRQDNWLFTGRPSSGLVFPPGTQSRDQVTSYIPYIGMQTSMYYPWWKARFEIMGSPFMTEKVVSRVSGIYSAEGSGKGCGLIEFRIEGTAGVTRNTFIGVNAIYSFKEVYGYTHFKNTPGLSSDTDYDLYSSHNLFRIGLEATVLY
jgi:hypothetical protein